MSGASAQTVQDSRTSQYVQLPSGHAPPNIGGGGCGPQKTNGTGDITAKACISYAYPYLLPDGYAWFNKLSGHGNVDSCRFRLQLWHEGTLIDQIDYNCSPDAAVNRQNVHYGPLPVFATAGVDYYTVVQVRLQYSDGYTTYCYPDPSPPQEIS